jgi:DNA-binding CsgD family transcriptional regulator
MPDDEMIARLLRTLYAAPIQPKLWRPFLEQLSKISGVTKAALITHDLAEKDHRMLATLGDSVDESIPLYESCYFQVDEWTSRFSTSRATGRIVLGEEVWPEAAFLQSTFYNEFLRRFDTRQMACLATVGSQGTFEALSIYRGQSEDEFARDQLAVLQTIVPHLQTALYTRRKLLALESRVSDLETALGAMGSAIVLIDRTGKTIFVNDAARAILAQGNGLFLHKSELIARNPKETSELQGLIARAVATAKKTDRYGGGVMRVPRSARRPLHVLVSPLRAADSLLPGKTAAAVFLSDPERQPAVPAKMLRTLFGLTSAESRLALSILEGNSLSEAAELHGVSRETVKSQINAVYSKTGTKRQGELIRLLGGLPQGCSLVVGVMDESKSVDPYTG